MNKKFWITAIAFGLPWAMFMVVFMSIFDGDISIRMIVIYLTAGVFGGILFSWVMQLMARRLLKGITITLALNEKLLKEAAANHLIKKEGVGGKLVLTNKQLIFKSHNFNIQNHQQEFDLTEIVNMATGKSMLILENKLVVTLTNQDKHIFIVDEPTEWIRAIVQQKNTNA